MASLLSRLFRPFSQSASSTLKMSTSSTTSAAKTIPEGAEQATVAAGCFWGVEHLYRKHFGDKGLYDARVGYIGGDAADPSYKAVCSGNTGRTFFLFPIPLSHICSETNSPCPIDAEATLLTYDPTRLTYAQLLSFFYRMHDPTTLNQQGPDRGTQYRSGIFYHNPEQEKIAREVTAKANEQWWGGKIVTELLPAKQWWDAEDYHQEYLVKNPYGYECPSHVLREFPELK